MTGKDIEVERSPDGDILLRHLPPALAWALSELPGLLSDEAPGISSRLSPTPYPVDGDEAEEWARNTANGLRHLFASARELVVGDLTGLERESASPLLFRIRIPAPHRNAWLSALAAARVALGDVHEVGADDMSTEPTAEPATERDHAILLIQLLGWVQALLVD